MLARTFLTATELNLDQKKYDALILALHSLESGELAYYDFDRNSQRWNARSKGKPIGFNMSLWRSTPYHACGTVVCMGGLAEVLGGVRFTAKDESACEHLHELFYVGAGVDLTPITIEQATKALTNFLTTGDPKWVDVLDEDAFMDERWGNLLG